MEWYSSFVVGGMDRNLRGPAGYRRRIVDDELDELIAGLPAIALEGPKAVGKTATALQRERSGNGSQSPD